MAFAEEPVLVKDIRVNGLQRITAGAVFNALSLKVGDQFEEETSGEIIRELIEMGFFSDINVDLNDDIVIINVKERPAITSIEIEGNDDIENLSLIHI